MGVCHTARHWTLLGTIIALAMMAASCGLVDELVPESAQDRGHDVYDAYPVVSAWGTRALPKGVTDLRFEIVDILIAPEQGDAWYLLIDRPQTWFLSQPDASGFSAALLPSGKYRAIQIVLDDAEIEYEGEWQRLKLAQSTFIVEIDLELEGQTKITLELQLDDALSDDGRGRWTLQPLFVIEQASI